MAGHYGDHVLGDYIHVIKETMDFKKENEANDEPKVAKNFLDDGWKDQGLIQDFTSLTFFLTFPFRELMCTW